MCLPRLCPPRVPSGGGDGVACVGRTDSHLLPDDYGMGGGEWAADRSERKHHLVQRGLRQRPPLQLRAHCGLLLDHSGGAHRALRGHLPRGAQAAPQVRGEAEARDEHHLLDGGQQPLQVLRRPHRTGHCHRHQHERHTRAGLAQRVHLHDY